MLSYRHAFHAGNHADVLKHVVLCRLLTAMGRKPAPYAYFESHAGAGRYPLEHPYAQKNREHDSGVGRLWPRPADAPGLLDPWYDTLAALNPDGALSVYPGSPLFAARLMRPDDRAMLCELHPADHPALRAEFAADRRMAVHRRDGYEGLRALLPPAQRRGLVLLDPSYERAQDYRDTVTAIRALRKHFRAASIALWYPLLEGNPAEPMLEALAGETEGLRAELSLHPEWGHSGLRGSGMLLLAPPWGVAEELEQLLPWLRARLAPADA